MSIISQRANRESIWHAKHRVFVESVQSPLDLATLITLLVSTQSRLSRWRELRRVVLAGHDPPFLGFKLLLSGRKEVPCLRAYAVSLWSSLHVQEDVTEDDMVEEYEGFKCVIDPKSVLYLYGLELDFSDALIGGGFQFQNPNAESSCGCGKSFGV